MREPYRMIRIELWTKTAPQVATEAMLGMYPDASCAD